MEPYIPISFLNDFIFCPRSIYFHQLYGRVDSSIYHSSYQTAGRAAHRTVDTKTYTTAKNVLQSLEVYSVRYGIGGKIDTYDEKRMILTERKKKIVTIYDGYVFQLYAQYYCLREMGYEVRTLKLYSMDDNKSYSVQPPEANPIMHRKFEDLIMKMKTYRLTDSFVPNSNKCRHCVYANLCDVSSC